jgi:capsule polysaccharide export protein KpsE/RkpR
MSVILIERFDLEKIYRVKGTEKAMKRLQKNTGVEIRPEGVIVLSVEDRDPERAYALVSTFLENIDSVLIDMSVESAEERRKFLAEEIAWRERSLASADSAVMAFLKQHGVYQLDQQARSALEVVMELNARLSILEVDKRLLEMTMRAGSPELEKLKRELENLREQIVKIQEGTGEEESLFPPLNEFPDIAAGYLRLLVELKAQEGVLQYVRLLLEDATIQANRKVGVLRIIDPPFVPEQRVWPKRKQIVIVSTIAVFFWISFAMLVLDTKREQVS